MERLLKYYLSRLFTMMALFSCDDRAWYQKELTQEQRQQYATQLLGGRVYHYQGSVAEQFLLREAMSLDSLNGDLWREFGTSRVKRSIADEMNYYYGKAVELKPLKWAGFRGYLWLYFYRDYHRAIRDFDYSDELMGEVGYSQGQNHDYMRGICYYGLKDYSSALVSLQLYIDQVVSKEGEEWVDVYAYLYKGLTLAKLEQWDEAMDEFNRALKYYPNLSDCFYHKARILTYGKDYEKALEVLDQAEFYFNQGYYHQRPYVEVLEQVYLQDIEELRAEINMKLFVMS